MLNYHSVSFFVLALQLRRMRQLSDFEGLLLLVRLYDWATIVWSFSMLQNMHIPAKIKPLYKTIFEDSSMAFISAMGNVLSRSCIPQHFIGEFQLFSSHPEQIYKKKRTPTVLLPLPPPLSPGQQGKSGIVLVNFAWF